MYQLFQRHRNKKKKGFTLIELIIVIAILAILAAILIPNMVTYIDEANTSVANANARSVYSAATAAAAVCMSRTPTVPLAPITDLDLSGATADNTTFQGILVGLLGDGMNGTISVTLTGTGAAATVDTVTWTDGAKTGTYPQ